MTEHLCRKRDYSYYNRTFGSHRCDGDGDAMMLHPSYIIHEHSHEQGGRQGLSALDVQYIECRAIAVALRNAAQSNRVERKSP